MTSFPDIKMHQFTEKTDFAVLGCDGIFEQKNNQQIVSEIYKLMRRNLPLDKITETMLDMLCSPNINMTGGLGCDNMSLIIIDFRKNLPPPQTIAQSPALSQSSKIPLQQRHMI